MGTEGEIEVCLDELQTSKGMEIVVAALECPNYS